MTAQCRIALPANYRAADILAYHLRDPSHTSERLHQGVLYKGLTWQGQPASLALRFDDDHVTAQIDAEHLTIDQAALNILVKKMLGLDQDIDGFEQAVIEHPELGPLVQRQRGLRVPVATTPFEALVWAIVGQQISVQAAVSIRRRFIQAVGHPHQSGLWCHPDAQTVATAPPELLKDAGLSSAKVRTLLAVSHAIVNGDLMLSNDLGTQSALALQEQLLAIRGIGPWTADYTLLRGYGWLDGSLHGDAAVRRSLRTLLHHENPVTQDSARDWLMTFSPWRALAAAHLWASQHLQA